MLFFDKMTEFRSSSSSSSSTSSTSSSGGGGGGGGGGSIFGNKPAAPPPHPVNRTNNKWLSMYSDRIQARNQVESEPFIDIASSWNNNFKNNLRLQRLQVGICLDISKWRHKGKTKKEAGQSIKSILDQYNETKTLIDHSTSFDDVLYFAKMVMAQNLKINENNKLIDSKDKEIASLKDALRSLKGPE